VGVLILISQWYEPSEPKRLRELQHARRVNESCGLFDACMYLDGTKSRRTFADLFDLAATHYRDVPCVVANTDITFDDGCDMLAKIAEPGRLIALTRWEDACSPRLIGHHHEERLFSGSQDSWVFVGDRIPHMKDAIPLGHNGCDQRVVGWAAASGIEVIDPAIDIRTTHHHDGHERPDRPSAFGKYGYPHLTGMAVTGLVLTHDWCEDVPSYVGKIVETLRCQR
jgi:hypothetical protein